MSFAFVLLLLVNGDPLPWAGFNDRAACEQVLKHLTPAKGVKALCVEAKAAHS